jgi:hypothetical protein
MLELFSTLMISLPVWATCDIGPTQFSGDACPVTVAHIERLADYYRCEDARTRSRSRGARPGRERRSARDRDCLAESGGSNTPLPPISFMLPGALIAQMTPEQRRQAIDAFFNSQRQDLTNQLARQYFEQDYQRNRPIRPPAIPEALNDLPLVRNSRAGLREQPNAQFLARLHRQMQSPATPVAQRQAFERTYRNYIRAAEVHGGDWSRIQEPNVIRHVQGNARPPYVDFANDPWDSIPENARDPQIGRPIRPVITNVADQQVTRARAHFLSGGGISDLHLGGDHQDNQRLRRILLAQGTEYRTGLSRAPLASQPALALAGRRQPTPSSESPRRAPNSVRLLGSGGVLLLASLVYEVGALQVRNQQRCEDAFPFYPTTYRRPAVHGLPLANSCHMEVPSSGRMSAQMQNFMELSATEQDEILNMASQGRSPCNYYRQAYNRVFCGGESTAEEAGEVLVESQQ